MQAKFSLPKPLPLLNLDFSDSEESLVQPRPATNQISFIIRRRQSQNDATRRISLKTTNKIQSLQESSFNQNHNGTSQRKRILSNEQSLNIYANKTWKNEVLKSLLPVKGQCLYRKSRECALRKICGFIGTKNQLTTYRQTRPITFF